MSLKRTYEVHALLQQEAAQSNQVRQRACVSTPFVRLLSERPRGKSIRASKLTRAPINWGVVLARECLSEDKTSLHARSSVQDTEIEVEPHCLATRRWRGSIRYSPANVHRACFLFR
jgi:hypothetical protein